jgi:hypothetical protein
VSFGFRKPQFAQRGYVPAWVAAGPNSENAVTEVLADLRKQFNDENPESGLKPVEELGLLKIAMRRAANGIRTSAAKRIASTTAHKLALTLKFIRSVELGQYEAAKHAQTRYGELQCVVSSSTKHSAEYKRIKDLAIELMHTDVGERIRELNTCRSSLPEEIYARRKNVISRRLKRLLLAGASNKVAVLKTQKDPITRTRQR